MLGAERLSTIQDPHGERVIDVAYCPTRALLSPTEIGELWRLIVEGAGSVLEDLWRSRGLCARHAWSMAVVEIDLVGGKPFSTAVLYRDLVRRSARALRHLHLLPWLMTLERLRARRRCLMCDATTVASGLLNPWFVGFQERVAKLGQVRGLLTATREWWQPRRSLGTYLAALEGRLADAIRSMSWNGPPATPEVSIAWIEALGWFVGWDFPLQAVGGEGLGPVAVDESGGRGRPWLPKDGRHP